MDQVWTGESNTTKPNLRFGQYVESTPGKVEVEQTWTDDDIVTHLRWVRPWMVLYGFGWIA